MIYFGKHHPQKIQFCSQNKTAINSTSREFHRRDAATIDASQHLNVQMEKIFDAALLKLLFKAALNRFYFLTNLTVILH